MSKRRLIPGENSGRKKKIKLRPQIGTIASENESDEDDELNFALQASRRIIPEPLPQNSNDQPGTSGAFHFSLVDEPENPNVMNRNVNFEGQSNNSFEHAFLISNKL